MSATPPIPSELWDKSRPDVRLAVLAVVPALEGRIAAPEARLGQDFSSHSSRPPSSDPIHVKRRPPRPPP